MMISEKNFSFSASINNDDLYVYLLIRVREVIFPFDFNHFYMFSSSAHDIFSESVIFRSFFFPIQAGHFLIRMHSSFFRNFPPNLFSRFLKDIFLILMHFPRVLRYFINASRCSNYLISYEVSFGGEFLDALWNFSAEFRLGSRRAFAFPTFRSIKKR